jgi:ABC-type phosphate transport system auxiliary subunit
MQAQTFSLTFIEGGPVDQTFQRSDLHEGPFLCASALQVDKLTANQKLDLNLERGRLREDFQQLRDKLAVLRYSLERELNLVRTNLESSKSETLKWVVVTVVGLMGAAFAAMRLSMN